MICSYREFASGSGFLDARRLEQSRFWMYETIREGIYSHVFGNSSIQAELKDLEEAISKGRITSHMAAMSILEKYTSENKNH